MNNDTDYPTEPKYTELPRMRAVVDGLTDIVKQMEEIMALMKEVINARH